MFVLFVCFLKLYCFILIQYIGIYKTWTWKFTLNFTLTAWNLYLVSDNKTYHWTIILAEIAKSSIFYNINVYSSSILLQKLLPPKRTELFQLVFGSKSSLFSFNPRLLTFMNKDMLLWRSTSLIKAGGMRKEGNTTSKCQFFDFINLKIHLMVMENYTLSFL